MGLWRAMLVLMVLAPIAFLSAGCGGGSSSDGDVDGDTGTDGDVDGDTGGCKDIKVPTCAVDNDCQCGDVCLQGVCVRRPITEITLWHEESTINEDFEKEGEYVTVPIAELDMSCEQEDFDELDAQPVTHVIGRLKVFGLQADCRDVDVEVFYMRACDFGDGSCDGDPYTDLAAASPVTTGVSGGGTADTDYECFVRLENVPTGRWLVFHTIGDIMKNTYQYNVYIKPADAGDQTDPFHMEVNVISHSSYDIVPTTAGVTDGIQPDRGAVAGTVKDCKGNLVKDATVGLSKLPTRLAYFNATVSDLLPFPVRTTTNKDATYAAVDQESGSVKVVASALVGGEVKVFGSMDISCYPDSVVIMPFRMKNPVSYPETTFDIPASVDW